MHENTVNHTLCIVVYFVDCNCVEKGTSWQSAGMIVHKFNIGFFNNIILLTNLERYS
jgi:hypothetical protein